jgi:Cu/Ag efflux pump CusA
MLPIALEWAIGLERLSPLAIVAIGGLLVSTFLTLVYVPMFYELFEQGREALLRRKQRRDSVPNDEPPRALSGGAS